MLIHRCTVGIFGLLATVFLAELACFEPFSEEETTVSKTKQQKLKNHKSSKKTASSKKAQKSKKPKQSYRKAWQLICAAEKYAVDDPSLSSERRSTLVAQWITRKVINKKARYWFIGLSEIKPKKRESMFRKEFQKAGLKDCPVSDLLFPPEGTSSSSKE